MKILLGTGRGGEIDDCFPEFKLGSMRLLTCLPLLLSTWAVAQTGLEEPVPSLSDLPSVEAKGKIPGLDEPASAPDLSGMTPSESPSIPQLRPPAADPAKNKSANDADWAAQAMLQKKEEARQKQKDSSLAEEKAREEEARKSLEKEKKEKAQSGKPSTQPSVAQAAVPGFSSAEAQKLPAVTGLDGVKPRGEVTGDGRVQPGFDAFTGPSANGPLGKDFQSGSKPIMPGANTADGRMQVSQVPEPPSGGYKRISQDPYSLPPGYGEKKPTATAPPPPKPVAIPQNPGTGDPKRVINDSKAGFSPYDNSRKVPDPRSQRRF